MKKVTLAIQKKIKNYFPIIGLQFLIKSINSEKRGKKFSSSR
jgi:hypothetical protein